MPGAEAIPSSASLARNLRNRGKSSKPTEGDQAADDAMMKSESRSQESIAAGDYLRARSGTAKAEGAARLSKSDLSAAP